MIELRDATAPHGALHETVVRTVAGWILGGQRRPGDALPPEAEIAGRLGVSRTSVREAIRVLASKGLVEARPRVGIRVRPREAWHLLDAAVLSWHPNLVGDKPLLEGLVEARRIVEPAAAELAARRASAAQLSVIEVAYLEMERAIPSDLDACVAADLAFHAGTIRASNNIVLAGMVETLQVALTVSLAITAELMASQARTLSVHRDVLDAIRHREPAKARRAMNQLLDVSAADLQLG